MTEENGLIPRRQHEYEPRVSPADKLISKLDGTYYKMSEVSEILGISTRVLRRLLKDPTLSAPSLVYRKGKLFIYLYTPEDVEDLRRRFASKVKETK